MKLEDYTQITIDTLPDFVSVLLQRVTKDAVSVIALHGDLGAGKTTLVQELGRQLGISEQITSPTFVIMKLYPTTHEVISELVHMDAYRIETEDELRPLRFEEVLAAPNTLVCIEWAENIKNSLPTNTLHVTLVVADETNRTVQVSGG